MEHLAICTGGLLTQAEHFGHNVFQNSFMSLLQPSAVPSGAEGASLDEVLPWALNGMLEVRTLPFFCCNCPALRIKVLSIESLHLNFWFESR